MKLRRIAAHNLRRFTAPVEVAGLGDGLNVLSAPNEQGKSTLFDGLQALFFTPHGGQPKEIKGLRPHAGGAPEMLAEIETGEGRFTLSKRWLSKARAQVHRDGRLIAQADEAEAWIARLAATEAGGPAGLLWVRQGLTGFSEGKPKEIEAARESRRDLLSSVAGEVEAMTGGARMDAALKRCREALETYATATGRPRTGGPWKAAQDRVEALRGEHDTLSQTVDALQADLDARKRARAELAELTDPEATSRRRTRLAEAREAHAAAERHAERLEALTRTADTARLQLDGLEARRKARAAAQVERAEAAGTAQQAASARDTAETAQVQAETEARTARAALGSTREGLADAETRLQAARGAQRARDTARQRAELADRLTEAQKLRDTADSVRSQAAQGPDAKAISALERGANALDQARALQAASAARLDIAYLPGREGSVTRDGEALAGGTPLPLPMATSLQIDGIGTLHFTPGGTGDDSAVTAAEEALTRALRDLGADTLDAARAAARARAEAERRLAETLAALKALAPRGIDALHDAFAALPAPPAHDSDAPPLEQAEADRETAEARRRSAEARFEAARDRMEAARTDAARAQSAAHAAADRLTRAEAALAQAEDVPDDVLAAARTALQQAELARDAARDRAPDLETTTAALTRADSAHSAAEERIARLNVDLATLDERVRRGSEGAVEERLEEIAQDLAAAESDLARIIREVAVLDRLAQALEAARISARDRYFNPVANALRPLLHLLWPEAQLDWDDADLLPRQLIRDGREEPVDILSGGTQEQLALLVRLAFARLLAQDGRAAPVILDDALVFTDDDRIERMFDALHRQASDVQIIVLTCRQRAFRDLGGQQVQIRPMANPPDSLLDL